MHKITVKDFPHLNFGDIRRDERFVTIINNISSQPGASIPKQNKSWYDTKATYEFFKNEDVSPEELKKTMMMYGAKKVTDEMTVLIAHDISNISYNDLQAEGLGYLDNKEGRGILCYSSIATTTEGLPLSLLYQHTWTRPLEELGKSNKRKQLAFEDKESYRWYEGMSEVNELLGKGVRKIHIADRKADVYELFFHAYESNTDLLIRARHNRSLSNGSHLWDSIAEQPVAATVSLDIPDKTGKKKLKVEAEVRYHEVEILRPAHNKDSYESVTLTAIEIKEKNDEVKDEESLQKAIAVYSMAAFRVMQLVYESRHYPEVSCEVVLTKAQWKTLYMLIHGNNQIPKQPPSLQQAVMWIGRLGGHLGRKSDGPPGLKTVWQGYQ